MKIFTPKMEILIKLNRNLKTNYLYALSKELNQAHSTVFKKLQDLVEEDYLYTLTSIRNGRKTKIYMLTQKGIVLLKDALDKLLSK